MYKSRKAILAMRLIITSFISIMLLCAAGVVPMQAQEYVPAKVEKTSEKVRIDGKVFYVHKVLAKQTLYSISKVYGVSIDAINAANPSLATEGLKTGIILYIPADGDSVQTSGNQQEKPATASPAKPEKKAPKESKPNYRKYNVKWYESIEDVAVKFNVTAEAIYALNGIDPKNGKTPKSILIPDKKYMKDFQALPKEEPQAAEKESVAEQEGTIYDMPVLPFQGEIETQNDMYDDGKYVISIVMPFNTDTTTNMLNTWSSDFYSGALIAVDSLKKAGKFEHFTLNVIDLANYSSSWELVSSGDLSGSELIIGPISERDIHPIAQFAKQNQIPIVSPLDLKTAGLAHHNPYFFLFPPQTSQAMKHQVSRMATPIVTDTTESVTIIYERGYENSDYVRSAMTELDSAGIAYKTFNYDFLSGRGIDSLMSLSLDSIRLNKVIIPSMAASFINDAMRNLNLIKSEYEYDIVVYGLSQWKAMETLENEYFHALDLRLVLSYYNDYNDPATKDFIRKYTEVFKTYPNSFSYQGYDIMMFFVEAMYDYGKNYPAQIINKRKSLLQSDVLFLPIEPGCGYWNIAFKDVCYRKGWQIVTE